MSSIEASAGRDDDLACNRAGRLSAAQSARMQGVVDQVARGGITATQLVALLVGMFAVPVVAQLAARALQLHGDALTALVAAGVVGSVAWVAGMLLYLRSDGARRRGLARDPYARALRDDVAAGRVAAYDGAVRWTGTGYEATAQGAPLHLMAHAGPVPVHAVAAPPGSFRFYALPTSRLVVALEPVGAGVDRAAYARALTEAMGAAARDPVEARAAAVEGTAAVRYETRFRADDDRSAVVAVLTVEGVPMDVRAEAAAVVATGFPLRAWFVMDGEQRRAVRLEPA